MKHTLTIKTYFGFCFIICFTILSGCTKGWLEEKSNQKLTVPATLGDFQGLMNNYRVMNNMFPFLSEIASDGHYVTDQTLLNAVSIYNSPLSTIDAYTWSKRGRHATVDDWVSTYQRVLIDNIVLDGLEKLTPASEDEQQQWNNIKGQALLNRATSFFYLAQVYTPPFNAETAKNDLGIVLKLSSDITEPSKRSNVQETYNLILQDLNEALFLLPAKPIHLNWGSTAAVHALLSRVYLCMEEYDKAFSAANNCMNIYAELLDYNDISPDADVIGLYNKEVLFHVNFSPSLLMFDNFLIDKEFYDLYNNHDLRKTRFFRQVSEDIISYKGNYDYHPYFLFCGIATDEMYLTRAECYARAGRTAEAMKDLNDLMIKRWDKNVSFPTFTATDAEDALRQILTERKKELIYRNVRWMDLRRLNKDSRFAVTLTRTVNGQTYTLEPKSDKYAFPVPDDIIEMNGIPQNKAWLE